MDDKIQKQIDKATSAVTKDHERKAKDATKRVKAIVDQHITAAKDIEDKGQKKAVTEALKALKTELLSPLPA